MSKADDLKNNGCVVALAITCSKKSKSVIKWASENLIQDEGFGQVSFKLLHVFPEITTVPTPIRKAKVGNGIPIAQVRDDVAAAYRKEIEWQTNEKLLPYQNYCIRRKIQAEVVTIESDDVVNAIADEIAKSNIKKLVIGASSAGGVFSRYKNIIIRNLTNKHNSSYWMPRAQTLSPRISETCPGFCTVYVIAKGKLASIRPSDPDANSIKRDEPIDNTDRFSNFSSSYTTSSQPGTILIFLSENPRTKQNFKTLKYIYIFFLNQIGRCKLVHRLCTLSSYHLRQQEHEDDGNSSSSFSDITDQKSKESSFTSMITDGHSWTTDQSSSLNASTDFSSGSQSCFFFCQTNINFELEQLRMELRHAQGMYAMAQNEALDASRKLNGLQHQRLEETMKLNEMNLKEEEAKELAAQEKIRYEAAKKEAEYAKECADKEAALKAAAEKKATRDAKTKEKLENTLASPVHHYQEFTWEEIYSATSSLSNDLRIGMGSYGTVYKCILRHTNAAVKILHSMATSRNKQFEQELEILSTIRHPNLLTLLGACPTRGCLVYEYMENGSLEERLFRRNNSPPIPWYERYRIAREVASALIFLHNSKPKPIIHRDLKPANILLDHNFVSKIGDVGLSTMLNSDTTSAATMYKDTSPVGTLCYIDPEYQRTGLVSPKSDVYAYGMVVLQLLTAKPAIALARTVEMALDDDDVARILDKEAGSWPIEETKELAELALRCTELRHRDRPDLRTHILPTLEKLRMVSMKAHDLAVLGPTGPPNHFICPLLKDVMNDPCVAADGYTYDRKAIEEWLRENNTSPVTNLPLLSKSLIPNHSLLTAIMQQKSA
ncbi:PREDICTED: U-box domain-containing protein 35-like [Erythranthe guttata]|uniref:U-box domain-containing protein 35-like n=1 Tax=Erythranthe guttata TaxID=4155 RepID=UPI00064DFBEF|nr:PREDICTED: U-box domain-containing protein 35-like [Erythranthe guttata]|eukprot:XP_012858143.1 PREDICTED: U-box domain-containing protein 35-like [Erythranthe guttata]